jgi:asparagine synthase (glutamine-hydrolysing)
MIRQLENEIIRNIHAIPRVPLSLLLSGGIDSSLVLALIKKEYPEISIHTFSLGGSEDYPDLVFAREVAKIFVTNHHEIILSKSEFEEYKRKYEKLRQYNLKGDVNVYILCSIARDYSKIIVTGDGGDECFGGFGFYT